MYNKKLVVISALIIALLVGLVIWAMSSMHAYAAHITLEFAPQDSKASIDGRPVNAGVIGVGLGRHKVSVQHAGFDTQTKTISVHKGQTAYAGIALVSNNSGTENWYQTHPKDAALLEKISGKNFNINADKSVKQLPLIKLLPYIGPGYTYRIDYGLPPATAKPGSLVGIYITFYTEAGRQAALNWITQRGYDTNSLSILYNDRTSQYQSTDNPYTN